MQNPLVVHKNDVYLTIHIKLLFLIEKKKCLKTLMTSFGFRGREAHSDEEQKGCLHKAKLFA